MPDPAPAPPTRRLRLYQWARRLSLAATWLFLLAIPLWHLRDAAATSGLSTSGSWAVLARLLAPGTPPPLLGAPWTVRLFGIEFLDPLAGLGVLLARAPTAAVLWGLVPTVVLVAVLGRFFCGWMCPYRPLLAVSNAARALLARLGLAPRDAPLPRRLAFVSLGTLLLVTLLAASQVAPVFYPPAVLGRSVLRAVVLGGLGVGALLVLLAFLFDTLVARAGFCRYLCPGGALMTLLGSPSPIRVVRDAEACTRCGRCDQVCNLLQNPSLGEVGAGCERCGLCIDACAPDALRFALRAPALRRPAPADPVERRVLLGAVPAAAILAVWAQDEEKPRRLRPPRAAEAGHFAARCIRCGRCAEVCPPKAIRFEGLLNLRGSDLPYVEPRLAACTLCMRCTNACPTGALLPTAFDLRSLQAQVKMGRPVLDKKKCLPWNREGICRLCYYACPYPDSAITLTGPAQTPEFTADKCVGCGRCEEVCPERARAITIEPREDL